MSSNPAEQTRTVAGGDGSPLRTAQHDRWIWPFELLDKVGEGGMGVVHRARYVVDNRHVAVKLLPPDVTDENILARFERELEILKTLRHPNIVLCFGGLCQNHRRFYAMELVEGGTLEELLQRRGRFPWEQVVEFARQMCAALDYAHERGVVHRDVKPGNFLLTGTGQLKLSDFGLASLAAGRKITAAGKTMGTYRYMAPEQIRGKAISAQTDLYALGCVLFELLTGRPPFEGDTPAEILQQHLKEAPPRVGTLSIDCPPLLEKIIAQLLEKEPGDRPESAAAVLASLKEISQTVVIETVRKPGSGVTNQPTALPSDRKSTPPLPAAARVERRPRTLPDWVLPIGIVALAVLLIANLQLLRDRGDRGRARELWLQAYQGPNPQVRLAAARALGELGTGVEALTAGLADGNKDVREASAAALGAIGADAKPAIPPLVKMQQSDEYDKARVTAGESLKAIRDGESESSWGFTLLVLAILAAAAGAIVVLRRTERAAIPP